MARLRRALPLTATLLLLGACEPSASASAPPKASRALPAPARGDFVRADGPRFVVAGRPTRVIGVNASAVHGEQTRADMPRLFEAMHTDHVQVARIWALGLSPGQEEWRSQVAFRTGPDEWVAESFAHLDALLVEARRRNVRVIVVLANRWSDRGGLPEYARWAGLDVRNRNLMPAELAATLGSERAQTLYLAHLERVVGRVNELTGKAYRDDPTIFAWELINELSASTCSVQEALLPWVRRMASRVHELDPNHLVAAGHIGYNSPQSLEFWTAVHRLDVIDYADTHAYPQNLLDTTSPARLGDWLDHRAARATSIGKPLLVGEVGVPRGDAMFSSRVEWLEPFFDRAAHNGTDGVLVWMYRPWQRHEDPHGIWPWGPLAEETAPLRALLSREAKRAAREPDPANDAEPVDWPLGVDRVAAYPEGAWEEGRMRLDPWAVAEGCARGSSAWLTYAIPWRDDVERLDVRLAGMESGTVNVLIDGVSVGTLRDGVYTESGAPLPEWPLVWLRLEAADAEGARALARFTRSPPDESTIEIVSRPNE